MALEDLRSQAIAASEQAGNLQTGAPTLLNELRQNLVSVFAKDNPVIQARDTALSDFLSTPARARADLLPSNLPVVEGSNLNLSPTQQNAITTSRRSAALAPLVGLNELVQAGFGNIGDIVGNAANIYTAQQAAAQNRANTLLDLYKTDLSAQTSRAGSATLADNPLVQAILGQILSGQQESNIPDVEDFYSDNARPLVEANQPNVAEPDFVYDGTIAPIDRILNSLRSNFGSFTPPEGTRFLPIPRG